MEDESRTPAWQTIVAALFAVGALGAVIWTGMSVLTEQVAVDSSASPTLAAERFRTAVNDDQRDGLLESAAGSPEAFFTALDTALEPLEPRMVSVEIGDVTQNGARADVILTWMLTGGDAGGSGWASSLELERRGGEWQPVLGLTTLHPQLRANWTFDLRVQDATRNPILDADGTALTVGGSSVTLGIEPRKIVNQDRLLNAWATTLPDSYEDLEELLGRRDLRDTWFYPVATITPNRFEAIQTDIATVPGVVVRESQDASVDDPFAIHVLGRVGEPSADMVAAGADEGTPIGLYGLEAIFEDDLVTGASATIVLTEEDGDIFDEVAVVTAEDAEPVVTTLQLRVQQALEDVLLTVDDNVAIVVLDVDDAAIRGSASRPEVGYNRAFEGRYTPGDSALPVMVDALVSTGVGMGTTVTCPSEDVIAGAQLTAPRPDDDTTLAAALAQGCDTTIGGLAVDLDGGDLVAAAERLGFGTAIDLPLPVGESSYPEPADTTERVRAAVGQAQILTSPLHVASMLAAAVSGTWHAPYLLADGGDAGIPLTSGTGTAMAAILGEAEREAATPVLVGTAERFEGGGRVTDTWALAVVDDLAVVVLVEDVDDENAARDLLGRLIAELS